MRPPLEPAAPPRLTGTPHVPARRGAARRVRPFVWPVVLAVVIAVLLPVRDQLDRAHVTLALLLVVLVAAADGGRVTGILTAALAFLGFNWFFLPPFGTLVIANPLDWFVLLAFLGTSVVASHLFHQVQREADEARERTKELGTLASLGAEAMAALRAQGALGVVADTARAVLGVAACRVHVGHDATVGDTHLALSLERGARVAVLDGDVVRILPSREPSLAVALAGNLPRRLVIPLHAGADIIGVLDVADPAGIALDPTRERLLAALAYYAALGVERARSERAVEHVEALQEAERMRNAVLASVSHDLRTPLTTIKALAHELGALGDERSEVIEQEADRLNRFVAAMLDLSRLTSGRFPLQPTVAPVDELVTAALQQTEGSFGSRRIEVQLPGDDVFPLARFDLIQSVRIVVNLLENARKYAPGDAPIFLVVSRDGDWLRISVLDRGPGVPPAEAERIF
ncbi:MAG: DUF4118 domain-containing protein, partial [Gemmatimonadota bacterium]